MGQGIHSGGSRMISGVSLTELTRTQITGRSQKTAAATITSVTIQRRRRNDKPREVPSAELPKASVRAAGLRAENVRSVFCMASEDPKLEDREDQNHGEKNPGHGRRGPKGEQVLKGRFVEVLDHGSRRVSRSPLRHDEHLP